MTTSPAVAAAHERPSHSRVIELDGIRGIAVLFILAWHYVGIPGGINLQPDRWVPNFHQAIIILKSGVDLFFVLSGFLITGILIDNRGAQGYYRTFFARRFCRIFPLYYALVLVFVLARTAGSRGLLFTGSIPLWSYISMTQNYSMAVHETYGAAWLGATWSLAIEEQFYLLFPFVVRRSGRALPWILCAAIILSESLRVTCYRHFGNDWAAYTWLPCRLDSLCWGSLVAWLVRHSRAWAFINQNRAWIFATLLVLLTGTLVLDAALARDIGYHMSYWGHSLLASLYAVSILVTLMHQGHRYIAFLRCPPLLFVGRISYGIYLFHGIILIAVFSAAGRSVSTESPFAPALIIFSLILTLIVCTASYRYLEQPFLRLGRRVSYS